MRISCRLMQVVPVSTQHRCDLCRAAFLPLVWSTLFLNTSEQFKVSGAGKRKTVCWTHAVPTRLRLRHKTQRVLPSSGLGPEPPRQPRVT